MDDDDEDEGDDDDDDDEEEEEDDDEDYLAIFLLELWSSGCRSMRIISSAKCISISQYPFQ